jgi:hypothetical protein
MTGPMMDNVRTFLAECTTAADGSNVMAGRLFDHFKKWCDARNHEAGNIHQFNRAMGYAGLGITRLDRGSRGYRGIYISGHGTEIAKPSGEDRSAGERQALAWLHDYDPDDGHGIIGHSSSDQCFTRAVVLAAFEAGLAAPRPEPADIADEDIDAYLPEYVRGEKRNGIQRSYWLSGWFVPWSPRNDNQNAEGPWSHWVKLARAIIAIDEEARARLKEAQA